ncbi:MAG: RtcB family protein [Chitinispirillaceae bacterium]|nr:RtcB family protein [Chitinispirillaceae bacterium]
MKAKKLAQLGIPSHSIDIAIKCISSAEKSGKSLKEVKKSIRKLVKSPEEFLDDPYFGELAKILSRKTEKYIFTHNINAPYKIWGEGFEEEALQQLKNACKLPVSVKAALMPDAHVGYGLPIGGVLATRNAVIPYAVGVDIACRMRMSIFELPLNLLEEKPEIFIKALKEETAFGVGATFKKRRQHKVMDLDWNFSPVTKKMKDKAWDQLGTSGSGNHFVEFGILTVERDDFNIPVGKYIALLSHSGSRGTGNEVAHYYSSIAREKHPELPSELRHLAWLDLNTEEGIEYWMAMELMGKYAAANHEIIHRSIASNIGVTPIFEVENHHNFAWKELVDGEELIVHRKGATPAAKGGLVIVPGSMARSGYVVRGKGNPYSINSAAHGAGRKLSRNAAKKEFTWSQLMEYLKERKVRLLSAGLDEAPMAYKDIDSIMAYQQDLVEIMAKFEPRIVRMAPAGEKPED